jgi:hypothetical protein
MKIDFSAAITDLDGNPIPELTLGLMATNALMGNFDDERSLSGDDKVRRFKLAQRVHHASEVDLTVEDVALIKKLIAKAYATLPCARAWELLDPPLR